MPTLPWIPWKPFSFHLSVSHGYCMSALYVCLYTRHGFWYKRLYLTLLLFFVVLFKIICSLLSQLWLCPCVVVNDLSCLVATLHPWWELWVLVSTSAAIDVVCWRLLFADCLDLSPLVLPTPCLPPHPTPPHPQSPQASCHGEPRAIDS